MQNIDYERLIYRRQYVIGRLIPLCPFSHKIQLLSKEYSLFYHIDLVFTRVTDNKNTLILLGDIYDYKNPKNSNKDILNQLIGSDFDALLKWTSEMAGRFVLIYHNEKNIRILHDASACRKIFYTVKDGNICCASTQHLLARVSGYQKTSNKSLLDYYQSPEFKSNFNSNIGYLTYYDEIKQVLPNHYLNIDPFEIVRYWPNKQLASISLEECVSRSVEMIKGFVMAAYSRYPLMVPITSGYDSRIILAALKEIKDKIFFYLNSSEDTIDSADSRVSSAMLGRFNVKMNLLNIDKSVDDRFRDIYFQNNPLATHEFLPIIYNYYKNFPEKLNLPGGTIPIIKALYHFSAKEITPDLLAKSYHLDKFEIAHDFYKDWFNKTKDVAKRYNYNIYDLLYWEDRTCNWGTQTQLDKDIAQEEFVPFNSRELISTMLAYDKKYRQKPYFKLNKEIIRRLWPSLLEFPFNPSFKKSIKEMLISLKLYKPYMKFKKLFSNK